MGSMRRPETSGYTALRHVITKEIEESISLTFEDGPVGTPETSVLNLLTPRKNPEDWIIKKAWP
jgi:hypothetical protein